MKKIFRMSLVLLTALCLMVPCCPGAVVRAEAAEKDDTLPLSWLVQAGINLMTSETNVTVKGQGSLSLDGSPFKQAEGTFVQDGFCSYQDISLRTPREDGSFRENGYAVVDYNGSGYSVERYLGRTYVRDITNAPKNHALRETVSSRALLQLGRSIAEVLDQQLSGKISCTKTDDGFVITLDWLEEDIPALLNAGLNLFWQGAVMKFFEISYHDCNLIGYAAIEDYMTTLEGILYCTRALSLQRVQLTAELDQDWRLKTLSGNAALSIECRNQSVRTLTADFSLTAENYGSTVLDNAIPEKNQLQTLSWVGITPEEVDGFFGTAASQGFSWETYGLPSLPIPESKLLHHTISSEEEAVLYAKEIAAMDLLAAGFELNLLNWSAELVDEDIYEVEARAPEGTAGTVLSFSFNTDGEVLQIQNHTTGFDQAESLDIELLDTDEATQWRGEIGIMLWLFTENLNPGSTMISEAELRDMRAVGNGFTGYYDTLSTGEETFVIMYGTLRRDLMEKVKFVVQTEPVVRVVLMDSTIDPMEAGNG